MVGSPYFSSSSSFFYGSISEHACFLNYATFDLDAQHSFHLFGAITDVHFSSDLQLFTFFFSLSSTIMSMWSVCSSIFFCFYCISKCSVTYFVVDFLFRILSCMILLTMVCKILILAVLTNWLVVLHAISHQRSNYGHEERRTMYSSVLVMV